MAGVVVYSNVACSCSFNAQNEHDKVVKCCETSLPPEFEHPAELNKDILGDGQTLKLFYIPLL